MENINIINSTVLIIISLAVTAIAVFTMRIAKVVMGDVNIDLDEEIPKNRISEDFISHLGEGEIFVFGSNLAGRHGAGAALTAKMHFGAEQGVGEGHTGRTYALPTCGEKIKTLSLEEIQFHVNRFEIYAQQHPELTFLVTEVACGLAGHKVEDIAPLFVKSAYIRNVKLPERSWKVITRLNYPS